MSSTKQSEKITARLDAETFEVVQHVAEVERRPVSAVVRNALADWARFVQQSHNAERRT